MAREVRGNPAPRDRALVPRAVSMKTMAGKALPSPIFFFMHLTGTSWALCEVRVIVAQLRKRVHKITACHCSDRKVLRQFCNYHSRGACGGQGAIRNRNMTAPGSKDNSAQNLSASSESGASKARFLVFVRSSSLSHSWSRGPAAKSAFRARTNQKYAHLKLFANTLSVSTSHNNLLVPG